MRPAPRCDACRILGIEYAAIDLVLLNRIKQRLEITFAKAVIAFALDDFKEDRTDHRLRENLQQFVLFAHFICSSHDLT